jgi:hypothetical protein
MSSEKTCRSTCRRGRLIIVGETRTNEQLYDKREPKNPHLSPTQRVSTGEHGEARSSHRLTVEPFHGMRRLSRLIGR